MSNQVKENISEVSFTLNLPKNKSKFIEVVDLPTINGSNLIGKRIFDLIGAISFFILWGWWFFPLIAILIKLDSKGPVFFKQKRNGLNNSTFYCYKFRSMVINKEADFKKASEDDPRITKVGKFIRKTCIDELPQFFNVLYGNMSLVGPRPLIPAQNKQNSTFIEGYNYRHLVKPGLTGLAQAKGYRGDTEIPNSTYFRFKLDLYYIKNRSGLFDLKILWMTFKSILF